jgi:hypothetical protein
VVETDGEDRAVLNRDNLELSFFLEMRIINQDWLPSPVTRADRERCGWADLAAGTTYSTQRPLFAFCNTDWIVIKSSQRMD